MADVLDDIRREMLAYKPTLEHNEKLLCILEGDLLKFVNDHLRAEFSAQAFESVEPRVAPINFLKRIIDKLSKIYQQKPMRKIVGGTDQDQELLNWYVKSMRLDSKLNVGNEYFNTFKTNLNQVYVDDQIPKIRPIPNDRFFMYSTNMIDRTVPTQVVLPFGQQLRKDSQDQEYKVDIFKVYSDDNIFLVDSEGNILPNEINPENENPFGTLNGLFMYVNRSTNFLLPPEDSDTFRMTILIPVLLSDLNYAVKYQAFSLLYGINVDDEQIKMAPNAFLRFKQEPGDDRKPEIGQIKPQVDISDTIQLIITELSMWLNSRNIRPGSISDVSAENMISGISKLVDEMDTSDDRQKQAEIYSAAEEHWWLGIMHRVHPYWVDTGAIAETRKFSPNAKVEVAFAEQLPALRRGQVVVDLDKEVQAGFISRETAMRKLNPEWDEDRFQEELQLIENPIVIDAEGEMDAPKTEMTQSGKTTVDDGHSHDYTIDSDGNGQTTVVDGHVHEIDGGVVMEADGHSHTLIMDG